MREADWQFLLPRAEAGVFRHLLLLGGSPALGGHVGELGIANRVSRSPGRGAPADLVVVLADAGISIDSLAPHIADDAVLYVEVDRRQPGRRMLTPRRTMRMLAAHGFTNSTAYWVEPGFPRREMYLPFGRRGALRSYLDAMYRPPSCGRRLLKSAMKTLTQHDAMFAAMAPCYAIISARGMTLRPPALVEQACGPGDEAAEPVLLAAGDTDASRLVFLLFDGHAERPSAVLKLARAVTFNDAVEREHAVLRDVAAMVSDALLPSIPPCTLLRAGDRLLTAEGCITGIPVASRSGASASAALDDLRCVTAWLTSFHRETTCGHVDATDWVAHELVGRLSAEYEALFGVTAARQRLFDVARRSADADMGELPIVWQHMDFGPWNIYREGAQVSVIDWKSARRGPALADLLYFVLHWSAAVHGCETRGQRIQHFESLFCAPLSTDATGRAIDAQLSAYMHAVGVAPALLPHVLLYTVLAHAVGRARLLQRTGRALSRDTVVNEYIGDVDVLARHQDLLFQRTRLQGVAYATG